jgi:hypothetical protein
VKSSQKLPVENCKNIAYHIVSYHYISLHGVVTLLDFCRRYGVDYRLLSTCVGSFTCPGIDAPVQGTTVWSPLQATVHLCGIFFLPRHKTLRYKGPRVLVSSDRPSLYSLIHKFLYVPWPGSNPLTDPFRIVCQAC